MIRKSLLRAVGVAALLAGCGAEVEEAVPSAEVYHVPAASSEGERLPRAAPDPREPATWVRPGAEVEVDSRRYQALDLLLTFDSSLLVAHAEQRGTTLYRAEWASERLPDRLYALDQDGFWRPFDLKP